MAFTLSSLIWLLIASARPFETPKRIALSMPHNLDSTVSATDIKGLILLALIKAIHSSHLCLVPLTLLPILVDHLYVEALDD